MHVRLVQMFDAVEKETNGRLVVKIFPNATLASQGDVVPQIREGAIQITANSSSTFFGGLVPGVEIDVVALAFSSPEQAFRAMDGALGAWVCQQFQSRGLFGFPKKFDLGMRQVSTYTKPMRSLADVQGTKLCVPAAKLVVDFWQGLGASPLAISSNQWYTSMQTHLADGEDSPLQVIEAFQVVRGAALSRDHQSHVGLFSGSVANGTGLETRFRLTFKTSYCETKRNMRN